MSLKYTTGARTRNVVNIAVPGGTTPAYSLTAANAAPNASTDGFKNFNTQRMLHVLIHNNALIHASGDLDVSNIEIWGYNESLGGLWTILTHTERANAGDTLIYPEYNNIAAAHDAKIRLAIPIEGVERIHVRARTFSHTRSGGTLDIYLGVNSI